MMTRRRQSALVLLALSGFLGLFQLSQLRLLHRGDDGVRHHHHLSEVLLPDYPLPSHHDEIRMQYDDNSGHDTFSACLLVMDDNHFLIEWLAYHYQVLPLRRLIIARDPRSRTSPSEILKRWQGLMNITEWHDDDYFHAVFRHSILMGKHSNNKNNTTTTNTTPRTDDASLEERFTMLHRQRQRFFFARCMKTLKMENAHTDKNNTMLSSSSSPPHWVALLDSDEFLTPNRNWKYHAMLPPNNNNQNTHKTMTIAHLLRRLGNYKTVSSVCIGLPRLLFGTKEDNEDQQQQQRLSAVSKTVANATDLLTLRYEWRAPLKDSKYNKVGKSLIDISRAPSRAFRVGKTDVHRAVKTICEVDGMWTSNADSPFVVHHYIGSYDQWMFRHDPRGSRTRDKYNDFQNVADAKDDSIQGWIDAFIQNVGPNAAKRLLRGVGRVERGTAVQGNAKEGVAPQRNATADLELLLGQLPDITPAVNFTRLT